MLVTLRIELDDGLEIDRATLLSGSVISVTMAILALCRRKAVSFEGNLRKTTREGEGGGRAMENDLRHTRDASCSVESDQDRSTL